MRKFNGVIFAVSFVLCIFAALPAEFAAGQEERVLSLFDFHNRQNVRAKNVRVKRTAEGSLRVIPERGEPHTLKLNCAYGNWDLSNFLYITMDISNTGTESAEVSCQVDGNKWVDGAVSVPGGEVGTLSVLLKRNSPPEYTEKYLFGMNGFPGGYVHIWEPIDFSKISNLVVIIEHAKTGQIIEINNIQARGSYLLPTEHELKGSFFPCISKFGQYIHSNWPGKTHSIEDMEDYRREEAADLAEHAGPSGWNKYGGWAKGPQLEATGHFRTEKYKDKWWLVDPDGRLFWSHGITCVRSGSSTAISGREHYFEELPEVNSPLGKFYGESNRAAHGYYKTHTPFKTYDFSQANLFRKCGEDWRQKFANVTHRRLRSWGMNTIANWSDPDIYLMRKTPYFATLGSRGRPIEGAKGHWRKFPDPFDEEFSKGLRRQLEKQKGKSAEDPWCIGYFVDNELTWGDRMYLAQGAISSGAEQPAKQAFVKDLRKKYKTIEKLNKAWETKHDSWDGLLNSTSEPDKMKAHNDLIYFGLKIAQEYFETNRNIIKELAPNKLYMGCRFDFHFYPEEQRDMTWLVGIATKYCDVVSFNRYRFSGRDLKLMAGADRPVIIGEWHMGALDRGMFHTGLRSVADQGQRAEAYKAYVRGSLENPHLVGTHWFQYKDQPTTGRADGENYQIGFVDICDTPYNETVEACREVGYNLYEYRLNR